MTRKRSDAVITVKYAFAQIWLWALNAAAFVYITPILQVRGFSSMEIGVVNASRYIAVIVFQMVIADIAERFRARIPLKKMILFLGICSGATTLIFYVAKPGILGTVIIFVVFGATINCILPLLESLALQYMAAKRNISYNISRACGSASWAVSSLALGVFSDTFGVEQILLLQMTFAGLLSITAITFEKADVTKTLENYGEGGDMNGESLGFVQILKYYPKYRFFLIGIMLVFMSYGLSSLFLINVVERVGGNHSSYGMIEFILAISEIPTALLLVRFRKKMNIQYLMVFCALFNTIKTAGIAFSPNLAVLLASQIAECFGLGIFYAGSVFFVMEYISLKDSVKANSMINVAAVGVGESLAAIIGGGLMSAFGLDVLLCCAVACGITSIIVMGWMIKARTSYNSA